VKNAFLVSAVLLTCLCTSAALVQAQKPKTTSGDRPYDVRTVEVHGASLRYLDFGGDGVPVVFLQTLVRPVEEYVEIGTRLSNDYRVLVLARRDEGGPVHFHWIGIAAHAEDVIGFFDALEIERAVLAGNTDGSYRMTYLAEEHPERVAGLIYLAGPPGPVDPVKDPASGYPMYVRRWGVNDGAAEEPTHAFRYVHEGARISVPALTFVPPDDARALMNAIVPPLVDIGSPLMADLMAEMARRTGDTPQPVVAFFSRLQTDRTFRDAQLASIEDPEARAYFQRLAADEGMQAEMARYWAERIQPASEANWASFQRAFGERLRVVELDVPGWIYIMAPDLIEPHIRHFLEKVSARERSRSEAPPTGRPGSPNQK
jgi:pimeloyl-ACP methyl ester carboxylesterase